MRWMPVSVMTVVAVLAAALPLRAQPAPLEPTIAVPRLVHVAGAFAPADGRPAAAVEVVTVSLYADQEGGEPLWQERQSVAIERGTGRFTVLLGGTVADGIPNAVFASGQAQWMSLLFDRPGEVEQPRVRIGSVPYALRAADAATLGGLPASAYQLAAPERGAAPAPGDARPAGREAHAASASVSPNAVLSGTTNFLAKYVNSADVGNSAVYEAGGTVGIGTTAPGDLLHLRFTNTAGSMTGLAVQNLGNTAASYSGTLFYDQNGALGQFQGFNNVTHEYRINNIATSGSINFMLGSSSKFLVASNGNIGMGTLSPSAPLEISNAVSGGTANAWITSYTNAVFGPYFMGRRSRGTFAAPTAVQNGDMLSGLFGRGYGATGFSTAFPGISVVAAQNWTDVAQGTNIRFSTTPLGANSHVTRMTLDAFGNLGIGTLPTAALDVVRDAGSGGATQYLTSYAGSTTSGESNLLLRVARGTAAAPTAIQNGDELGGYGMTGYGTTAFGDGNTGMAAYAAENWTDTAQGTVLVFGTTPLGSNSGEVAMFIQPDGHTGIGVPVANSPVLTDRLEVYGDVRVGNAGTNGCVKNFAGTGLVGTCASDRRFKKDITPFAPALKQLTALQPVHYYWRTAEFPERRFGSDQAYGLIAQDVEAVLPELVVTGADGFKAVDYTKLPLLTIQALKELHAEKDALQQRVDQLERLVKALLASTARQ